MIAPTTLIALLSPCAGRTFRSRTKGGASMHLRHYLAFIGALLVPVAILLVLLGMYWAAVMAASATLLLVASAATTTPDLPERGQK
jgi:hypothetical protein